MKYPTAWAEYVRAVGEAEPVIRNSPPDAVYEIRDRNGSLVAFKGESRFQTAKGEVTLRLLE